MADQRYITKKMLNDRLSEDARRIPDSLRSAIGRKHSTLSRIMRRYLVQSINCIIAPLWIILLRTYIDLSWTLVWSYIVYTLIFGILYLQLYTRLRKVPMLMALPLIEGQRALISIDTARRRIKYTGWILCVPVITLFFYELAIYTDPDLFWGAIVGGVIGGTIGLIWEIKNRRQMRTLIHAFDDPESDL